MWVYITTVKKWNGNYITYNITSAQEGCGLNKKYIHVYKDNNHKFELIHQVWLGINVLNYFWKYMIELVRFTWITHKNVIEYTFYLLSEWEYIWVYSIWNVTSDMASFHNNSKKIKMAVSLIDTFFNIHWVLYSSYTMYM